MKKYLFLILLIFFQTALAKDINLYEQPKSDAKIVGSVDSEIGIIPIFTPKDVDWIKVGDPRNGNVGWVKKSDMGGLNINLNIIKTGKNGQSYQAIQYGGTQVNPQQLIDTMQQLQQQQNAMQNLINDMQKNMPKNWMNVPMIMPVLVVPEKNLPKNPPAKKP